MAFHQEGQAQLKWFEHESEHFVVYYLEPHGYLVPHIVNSAETALDRLSRLFHFRPSEKIVIRIHDFSDYGSAGATAVPHNSIRLEIEPLEPGYENIPYNERIQWLIAHELVHIFVTDQASRLESYSRFLFSKVPPEKEQPLSIFYSLMTSAGRYTPRWHQEGIAVFMETWLSGGYGRVLGNFDEMYFRSLVLEGKSFPGPMQLEASNLPNSFLLETRSYLFGARFAAFLAAAFGVDALYDWYNRTGDTFYPGFDDKIRSMFGFDLSTIWKYFVAAEKRFQRGNLRRLSAAPTTAIRRLWPPFGWVTQPHYDDLLAKIIVGIHQPHKLTTIQVLDVRAHTISKIGTLPTPSIIRIASTAYNKKLKTFFFTTNNNQLYRDIWSLNLVTKKKKKLFEDARVGAITVSFASHELWGVRHSGGKAALVYAAHPYSRLQPVVKFELGDVIHDLAISPSGRILAATLHRAGGQQTIILANVATLKSQGKFIYKSISTDGSPEFPSWSPDERYLYWSAYTNGVSNIYRYDAETRETVAMSHTLRGLFRPVYINERSLFAFEFSSEGFIPVIIPNEPAVRLPAIAYFGQLVVDRNPGVTEIDLASPQQTNGTNSALPKLQRYSGLGSLKFHSFFPTISGFQDQKVVGFFSHLADPLFTHDLSLEFGFSPFDSKAAEPNYHLRAKYEYNKRYSLTVKHNAATFYDLFNDRKAGLTGTQLGIGNTHYWKFDNPHKIKQTTELTYFTGIKAINDNVIAVLNSDFFVFESSLNSRSVRRAIGSVDSESGYDWTLTGMTLASRLEDPQVAYGLHFQWTRFTTWVWPHNVFVLTLGGGLLVNRYDLAIGRFYFGGFGNRKLEDKPVKQYRELFRFSGIPIYSLSTDRFAKVMIEHAFPPVRAGRPRLWKHSLSHAYASWFAQALILDAKPENKWLSLGAQVNFVFNHWFNLESTLSFGFARAFSARRKSNEWFFSLKLLRD
ncbi:PD40 domain-containing protein [candidate division KSB1 bacterium]|nr:PD40 domain-containing protein [candidate division KSB1 bacterium]